MHAEHFVPIRPNLIIVGVGVLHIRIEENCSHDVVGTELDPTQKVPSSLLCGSSLSSDNQMDPQIDIKMTLL